MKQWRLGRNETVLLALLVVLHLANAWYGYNTWEERDNIERLEKQLEQDQTNLRRLRNTENLSSLQQELAALEAKSSPNARPGVPANLDTLQLVSDLANVPAGSGLKVQSFKARDAKTETIENATFQVLGYDVSLQGGANEMLGLMKRVDESPLSTLKIVGFTLAKQEDLWSMKMNLTAHLLAPAPAPPPAPPAPAPKPTPGR